MIEINLVPDVKQELIKAQRIRSFVVFIALISGFGSVAVTVLLALYVFGVQLVRDNLANDAIKAESAKLSGVNGINEALTIQNQMNRISDLHKDKKIDSRIFSVLTTIIPPAPNDVIFSSTAINSEENKITIEAQANNGFPALEVFLKTIQATQLEYMGEDGKTVEKVALASDLIDTNKSFGQDASGRRVLRFTVSFVYPNQLFARDSSTDTFEARIVGPTKSKISTDSYVGVDGLFTTKAKDTPEEDK